MKSYVDVRTPSALECNLIQKQGLYGGGLRPSGGPRPKKPGVFVKGENLDTDAQVNMEAEVRVMCLRAQES